MFKNQITDVFFDLDHTLWDFEKKIRPLPLKRFWSKIKFLLN